MNTVFLLLILLSIPNQPSVTYKGILYFTELECLNAKQEYKKAYENKSLEYKQRVKTEAFCIPFDALPLTTLKKT